MFAADISPRFLDMIEYFFKLVDVYFLQNDLLTVEFVSDFRQGNIPEIVFDQRNQLREIAIQLGTVQANFRDLNLSQLPVILVGGFDDR